MAGTPVSTPDSTLPAGAPSGGTGATAKCCPDVSTFEVATRRGLYFGFDDTTNTVANPGDEYWSPPTKAKSLPSDRETRDGARWVSVGLRQETMVEINFDGNFTNSCIANCTYEFDPPDLAEVTGPAILSTGVGFKIKGKSEGEGSLKVMCEGQLRGYFHIWCVRPVEISVDVATLISPSSREANYDASALETYLNDVFRQAVITINVNDLGPLTIAPPFDEFPRAITEANRGRFETLDTLARAEKWRRAARYRLYYYIPKTGEAENAGYATQIGASGSAFTFDDSNEQDGYHTLAHELAHLLGLSHPVADYDMDEFPEYQLQSLLMALNVTTYDVENLMGYYGPSSIAGGVTAPLRYRQWKKCNRR